MKVKKKAIVKSASMNKINAPSAKMAKELTTLKKRRKDDPEKYGVEKCCVKSYWAVIEKDGSLVRGRSVLRTRKLGTGTYEVFFTGKVDQGLINATIGRPGISTEPPGEITVAVRCCPGLGLWTPFDDNRGVWITTHDSDGKRSDRSFHLLVMTQE